MTEFEEIDGELVLVKEPHNCYENLIVTEAGLYGYNKSIYYYCAICGESKGGF